MIQIKKKYLKIIAVFVGFMTIGILFGAWISAPAYEGEKSDHFDGTKFRNRTKISAKGAWDIVKWGLTRTQADWKAITKTASFEKPLERVEGKTLRVTFVNHSTFLIQTQGLNILTDPIWSDYTAPIQIAGPARQRPAGIRMEDLPPIDLILISHNHYDHLDINTLLDLTENHTPKIVTPLGISQFLENKDIPNSKDLDWWEMTQVTKDVEVVCVPAQHSSGRGLFDRDRTLWAGFVLKTPHGNLYFAGDTGYDAKIFQEIGEKYAPLRLAFLPIGAYLPRWFMHPVHISPKQAVQVYEDLGQPQSIAMHFGTFPLADDGQKTAPEDLRKALFEKQIPMDKFRIPKEGKALVFE